MEKRGENVFHPAHGLERRGTRKIGEEDEMRPLHLDELR